MTIFPCNVTDRASRPGALTKRERDRERKIYCTRSIYSVSKDKLQIFPLANLDKYLHDTSETSECKI
jgi:hypothetical protein